MHPLEKSLRNQLEKTIKDARDTAESAAHAALEQLGVGEAAPFVHLSDPERDLRRKLRVHGRQLGDLRNAVTETQEILRLIEEVAYEHWHRMLFARFLAENNLLMYPDPDDPVAVTLEECEDLAADEGAANGWELAARYAARMLPQIFRLDSPAFQLTLPPEHQQKLEQLIAALPLEVFTAADSLGWVYQFWQAKKKAEVNASEVKIGARELPAVTQLFTEPYMVSFLLDNSLGAWWAARRLSEKDFEEVTTESTENTEIERELRRRASIPGVPLEYLRFIKEEPQVETDGDGLDTEKENIRVHPGSSVVKKWVPAAGTFSGWPDNLAELKTLDPCCGSGHFLVAAFLMLVPMRIERENLTAQDAVDAVLRENIHGLELDQRCVELAAFALALTAWKYPGAGGYRILPELNIACSGLSISAKKDEWLALAGGDINLRHTLGELYKQFKDAPVLGSLINPEASLGKGSLFELKWEEVGPFLTKALAGEKDDEKAEIGVVARGISNAARILMNKYFLVLTNVPYLSRIKQTETLKKYCDIKYSDSKNDLANVFLERCFELTSKNGVVQVVMPQSWLFLAKYKKQRKSILATKMFNFLVRLGTGAFDTISGEVVNVVLFSAINNAKNRNCYFSGFDAGNYRSVIEKSFSIRSGELVKLSQTKQIDNPDSTIVLTDAIVKGRVGDVADSFHGITTTDLPRFARCYWELIRKSDGYIYQQGTVGLASPFGGKEGVLLWENGSGGIKELRAAGATVVITGLDAWGRNGVVVNRMNLGVTLYRGDSFDTGVAVLVPRNQKYLLPLWAFCSSPEFSKTIKTFNDSMVVEYVYLPKIPFDLDHWTKIAEEKYPNGLPKPYSDDPTQWIFHGHPCGSVVWDEEGKWTALGPLRSDDTVLQVAVARLLGYRWPAELDTNMELTDEQRERVNRCEALLPFADEDGIVCIPPVRGEEAAADRLLNLLAAAYGDDWSNDIQAQLLKNASHAGKTLETWLREKFFTQHCKLFKHRPFILHIWDGLSDGFAALVNYHKLDAKLLETLIYTYLGDWISRQKQDIANGIDGAQEKLAAAENLKKKLELILLGEAPYDIFVRWKAIEKQPLGWNPDLNDGIRLNIRPFMTVPDIKKRGAGVLRDKPNIKWTKDRGKDVNSAPWFHLGPEYSGKEGDRINDHHLSLAEKRNAREATE